ncbi:MFS transporter [Coralloluteibacterium stylophorae]|uniref:MFS transporter n=1 Tax=Coralloluteibacterium stylophorae TaxID=1776034 RepID=A0A8J7VVQ9_9GAMM|nr:MFS transporter [Coralloluteibacterium stylophorae]
MADSQFALLAQRRFLPFFLTQLAGAFNDNVFRNALLVLIAYRIAGLDAGAIGLWTNLAAGLFVLPFLLFSASAGQWAERVDKARAIRHLKLAEIAIMLLAGAGFLFASLPLLMLALFGMGTQSALFGPLKYAILPQALQARELVGGNALVESGTFLAILAGTLGGALLMGRAQHGPAWTAVCGVAVAVAGWLASRAIPSLPAVDPDLVPDRNPLRQTLRTLRVLRGQRAVLNSVLGISWFWFFGAIVLAQLPAYARDVLGGNEQVAPLVLALFSIGIAAGSLLCERLSGRRIEIGLVPLGAFGLTVFGIDLYLVRPAATGASGLGALAFLQAPGGLRIALDLVLIGVSGGLYTVPLYALVQQRAPRRRLSQTIAANNILNALFMVAAALLALALFALGLTIPQVLLATAVLNGLVAVYIFSLVPEFLMRFLSWVLINLLYRVRSRGLDALPEEGPALVVANHVSFMDPLVLMGSIKRPVRFVMDHRIYRLPLLKPVFRAAGCIPIAGAREDPALMERAFEAIAQALDAGEVVGIFPEGGLTRDGAIQPFRPGVERILARNPVPVLPVALRGLWASMWSRRDSALGRARLPRRIRARVEVEAGPPMAPGTASAAEQERVVRALRGDDA